MLKKGILVLLLVLAVTAGSFFTWNIVGDQIPLANAHPNDDELDLCLLLNTYVSGPGEGDVDWPGFWDCVKTLLS